MEILLVSIRYSVEFSPVIKGMCSCLAEAGHEVDIYVDDLLRDPDFELPGARVINAGSHFLLRAAKSFLGLLGAKKWLRNMEQRFLLGDLSKIVGEYDWVLCAEANSLDLLLKAGADLSRMIYLSLESTQLFSLYTEKQEDFKQALASMPFCVIQSPERGKGLEEGLGLDLDFAYLPVSLRPRIPEQAPSISEADNRPMRIVYSGYFAPWAKVIELVQAFGELEERNKVSLQLHGHAIGTEKYFQDVFSRAQNLKNVKVKRDFMDDESHAIFLDGFDIGIAFYGAEHHNEMIAQNWQHLIFASGKIATYLWSGLAVLTNIDSPISRKPPFLYVDEISSEKLAAAIEEYSLNKELYGQAALDCAAEYYNLDRAMAQIIERIKDLE